MTAKEVHMGNYTIRTDDEEDQVIRKAQEATGMASASKAFMVAIQELQHNRDTIASLRQELAQEKAMRKNLAESVQSFRKTMHDMFDKAEI
ncbi:hypothetical protein [Erwinia aphidicola]|uniref:hypothetical protein n=1 Tax=Erwinia aphidicola TaxID=68334 RepID=UPI001E2D745A|nr:hypothetical protein [Erwinia aphidicola]